jgi:hypothetical protein
MLFLRDGHDLLPEDRPGCPGLAVQDTYPLGAKSTAEVGNGPLETDPTY